MLSSVEQPNSRPILR